MQNSSIEWCDHTFNPWEGCTRVSPGCAHCYAERRNSRFGGGSAPNWGIGAPRRRTSVQNWRKPRKWDEDAADFIECTHCGYRGFLDTKHSSVLGPLNGCPECDATAEFQKPARPRVFCASLADWLDPEVPIQWLSDLLDLIRLTPNLDWLLLTKRPELWAPRLKQCHAAIGLGFVDAWLGAVAPSNVWIGTTVEDQKRAEERIPELLKIPACIRFLSCEPLLGSLRFSPDKAPIESGIHWVIAGGESGPGARPVDPRSLHHLRAQCEYYKIPFFFKQWGEHAPDDQGVVRRVGKKAAGRLLEGIEYSAFPTP